MANERHIVNFSRFNDNILPVPDDIIHLKSAIFECLQS